MTCVVLVSLCHWWADDNLPRLWRGQIPVDANAIDKQPKSASRQKTLLSTFAYEQAKQQAAGLFTPFVNPEQLFLLEGCTSPAVQSKKQVSALSSAAAAAEVKELCPHQC